MSALDRRAFLKGLAATATGAAVVPGTAVADRRDQQRDGVWREAPCTLCSAGCGLLVRVENGRAAAVKGNPDSAVSRGLACAKGYHAVQMLYGRDRITHASIRRGGARVRIALPDALDLVTQRLQETLDRHGGGAVALYGSGQWTDRDAAAATQFGRALGSRYVDTEASLYAASSAAGRLSTFGADHAIGSIDDIDNADVFVLWNHNMAETDPVLFSRMLARRRTDPGVRIIDVTTRTARTSYAADRSILYAPGTELVILNALCGELIRRRLIDREFVDAQLAFRRGRTSPGDGRERLVEDEPVSVSFADLARFLEAYTIDHARHVSGMAAEDVRWLAAVYGDRSRRVTSVWGDGVNAHARGTWVNTALHNVHLLTGRIDSPGDAALSLSRRSLVHARPSDGALPMFRAVESGAVRFLWIQSADPMLNLPNLRRFRQAATAEGLFVVVSDAYPTPTTDIADVVLPSALWIERDGSVIDGRGDAQPLGALVRPPGDARTEAWQMAEVARRLGRPIALTATAAAGTRPAGADTIDDGRPRIWLRPHEAPPEPADAEYPFTLAIGAVLEHADAASLTRRVPVLHRAVPHAYVELNREDAEGLGIRSGERVRLVSRRASLDIEARVDVRSQPPRGQLFVPRFDEAHPVNVLTLDTACPVSGQPDYRAAVRVVRIAGGAGP
jgi:nitrate reductase (cytochrome)